MNNTRKTYLENEITNELWKRVNKESSNFYYVKDVKGLVEKMKNADYSLISIPEQFTEKYEREYADYVSYIVLREPKQTLYISEPFIKKNVEFACALFDDLVEEDPKNFSYIEKKISAMDSRDDSEQYINFSNQIHNNFEK